MSCIIKKDGKYKITRFMTIKFMGKTFTLYGNEVYGFTFMDIEEIAGFIHDNPKKKYMNDIIKTIEGKDTFKTIDKNDYQKSNLFFNEITLINLIDLPLISNGLNHINTYNLYEHITSIVDEYRITRDITTIKNIRVYLSEQETRYNLAIKLGFEGKPNDLYLLENDKLVDMRTKFGCNIDVNLYSQYNALLNLYRGKLL